MRTIVRDVTWVLAVVFVSIAQPLYLLPIEQQLPITLALVLMGLFAHRPIFSLQTGDRSFRKVFVNGIDAILILIVLAVGVYLSINYSKIIFRQGDFTSFDLIVSILVAILVFEGVRRAVGWALTLVCLFAILYALFGPYMPGPLMHRGYTIGRISQQLTLSYSGIFGTPLQVMIRYVILFIVFGSFLQVSGAAEFLIKFAKSFAGRFTGGLGKVAVVASALVGTISGSAAGNVATTGSVTIPAMKRDKYEPHFAGAIEAVASTGGQIMPPVMGAAAFLMADYLGIPYVKVATAAIIPALFYFLSAGIAIDLYARYKGIKGLPKEEIPPFLSTLKEGWYYLSAILIVYVVLIVGYSATIAGFIGVITALTLTLVKRVSLKQMFEALVSGGEASATLCAVSAGAGIIVGIVQLTGIGAQLASILVDLSQGSIFFLLILVMVASIILGMGMPTTVVYVLLAALVAPALVKLGITPLAAHFFIFYFGVLAAITPPVALASYAAASIAGSNFNQTGWTAFKISLPSFIVPFFFTLNPSLLLQGDPLSILYNSLTATIGIAACTTAAIGYFKRKIPLLIRFVLFVGSVLLIHGDWKTDVIGVILLTIAIVSLYKLKQE
ncbi:MAG: TRAP transporter permease [Spirochaetes bacterium]|nr:TRAP transporter permease [Spirochaetota bacterium]